jgi:hypothetical protein
MCGRENRAVAANTQSESEDNHHRKSGVAGQIPDRVLDIAIELRHSLTQCMRVALAQDVGGIAWKKLNTALSFRGPTACGTRLPKMNTLGGRCILARTKYAATNGVVAG